MLVAKVGNKVIDVV